MLSAILKPTHNLIETPPNCSTTSGVTSTLLRLNDSHQVGLIELGMVESKQFERAVRVVEPNIAVVTNIGEAHLASLGDKYLIADAKLELVRSIPPNGYAVLNIDDDLVSGMGRFSPSSKIIKFGLNKNAHFYANNIQHFGPDGISFKVNGFYPFHLPIYSTASIYNALSAITVARILDIEYDQIQEGLENRFSLLERRGNLIKQDKLHILDYSYDATINSVTKACESLVQFKSFAKKLILVIGDISNPAPNVKETHLKMGYYISALPIDIVITIGEQAKYVVEGINQINHTKKKLEVCSDHEQLLACIKSYIAPETTLLFIGSSELNLDQVIGSLLKSESLVE